MQTLIKGLNIGVMLLSAIADVAAQVQDSEREPVAPEAPVNEEADYAQPTEPRSDWVRDARAAQERMMAEQRDRDGREARSAALHFAVKAADGDSFDDIASAAAKFADFILGE